MDILKKISAKTVCGKIKDLVPKKEGQRVELYTVIGTATGYLTKESDFGTSVCLKGNFKATRSNDKSVYTGTQCYLSDEISDAVVGQLNCDGVESVDFGFAVAITATDSTVGYEYNYSSLIDFHQADPLQALEDKIKSQSTKKLANKPAQKPAQKPTLSPKK